MSYISIPKNKYRQLESQAQALRELKSRLFELALQDPIEDVVSDFQRTGKYSSAFLKDLETGLRLSSYRTRYASKASAHRPRKAIAKK